eukprot:358009-Chlamydomonas_euryale.AAC.7
MQQHDSESSLYSKLPCHNNYPVAKSEQRRVSEITRVSHSWPDQKQELVRLSKDAKHASTQMSIDSMGALVAAVALADN